MFFCVHSHFLMRFFLRNLLLSLPCVNSIASRFVAVSRLSKQVHEGLGTTLTRFNPITTNFNRTSTASVQVEFSMQNEKNSRELWRERTAQGKSFNERGCEKLAREA